MIISKIKKVADVTAKEGRALHNMILEFYNGTTPEAGGLNCFSPNINLIRDPRYFRDSIVICQLGSEYGGILRGSLSNNDSWRRLHLQSPSRFAYLIKPQQKVDGYYMLAASPKHFAVHSGPDSSRLSFVANATEFVFACFFYTDTIFTNSSFPNSKPKHDA